MSDATMVRAAEMIDRSGLVEQIRAWKEADRRGPGGRPETFPVRALLVAVLVCAMTDRPLLATCFTDVLFRRVSPAMRAALGVPVPPGQLDVKGWDAVYRNVRTRFHALLELIDPSPAPKNRRLSHDRFVALVELRGARRSAEEWRNRNDRLEWFVNAVIEMSLRALPREIRRRWKGSAAVDATVVPAFARHERRAQLGKANKKPVILTHSADPDAAWYVRGDAETHDGDSGPGRRSVWGYELTMVVAGSDDPHGPQAIPSVVMGMAPLHKPGHDVGVNALRALRSVSHRGHPAGFLAADRAYTNAKPNDFQLPVRALGYSPVLDYKIDQLGVQSSFGGMLQIEGAWYCPSIPEVLVTATMDLRNETIDEAIYRDRLEERWRYQILSKAHSDDEGHIRMRCPAADPHPQARCELKPRSEISQTRGKLRIQVRSDVRDHPDRICTQQSVTVPPEAGAKFAQELRYGSDEWHDMYATLRNSVEGMNGYIKDGAHEALENPQRRRIRGVAAQSVLVTFLLCAANLRKIATFMQEAAAIEAGTLRRLPRRRRSKALDSWRPSVPAGAPVSSPDPPLTA